MLDRDPLKRFREQLGRGVRQHRLKSGITRQQLAARTEELGYLIPEAAIAEIERGRWAPRRNHDFVEELTLNVAFDLCWGGLTVPPGAVSADLGEEWLELLQGPSPPPRSEPGDTPETYSRRFIRFHPESGSIDDDSPIDCTCRGWASRGNQVLAADGLSSVSFVRRIG